MLKREMVKKEVINKGNDSKGRSLLKVKIRFPVNNHSRVDGHSVPGSTRFTHGNVGKMCLLDNREAPPVR